MSIDTYFICIKDGEWMSVVGIQCYGILTIMEI